MLAILTAPFILTGILTVSPAQAVAPMALRLICIGVTERVQVLLKVAVGQDPPSMRKRYRALFSEEVADNTFKIAVPVPEYVAPSVRSVHVFPVPCFCQRKVVAFNDTTGILAD